MRDATLRGPRRALYLITELEVGGAERALLELVRRLDRSRFQPTVCSLAAGGALAPEFVALGVEVLELGINAPWHLPRMVRLFRLFRQRHFDLLHTFLFHANVLGRLAAKLTGVPVVVSSLRVAEPRRWHLLLERWTAPWAAKLIAVSEGVRRHLVERAHISREKMVVIPNGVDLARFQVPRGAFRQAEGIGAGRLVITTVGRLEEQKGIRYLLESARQVIGEGREVLFLVVGEGPERRRLLRLRDSLGLRGEVRFLGFRTDVPQILVDSDIFVLPSLWEGLANVMLEAMAAGLPVVVTDVEGAREVVSDGETGLVVPPRNAGALTRALVRLVGDPSLRRQLARAGRERVLRDFRWEKVVADTVTLYDHLLTQG